MNFIDRLGLALKVVIGNKKALAELHPESLTREYIGVIGSDDFKLYGQYDYLKACGDYASYIWVHKAVKIIADNFSSLPVYVARDGEEVEGHPLTALLQYVNDTMTSPDLWQQWCIDMLLGGETFWEIVKTRGGQLAEIWTIQPNMVDIIKSAAPGAARYRRVGAYKVGAGTNDEYALKPDECVHFKFYNPTNPWRGLSVIASARAAIAIDKTAQSWTRNLLENGGVPSYAIVAPQGTTLTEQDALAAKIMQQHGGAESSHRPIVLEEGIVDVKPISIPPKDMEWLDQRKMARQEIVAMFGVSEEMAGFGTDTYNNIDTARKVLWTDTIMPLATLRDTTLTEWARNNGILADGEEVVSDYDAISVLKEDYTQKIDQARKLWDMGVPFNTLDEVLELGIGAIEGGDVGKQVNPTPISLDMGAGDTTGDTTPDTPPQEDAQTPKAVTPIELPVTKAVTFGSDEHRAMWETFAKRTMPYEARMRLKMRDLFEQQTAEVQKKLVEAGAVATAANPFSLVEWKSILSKEMLPIFTQVVKAAGEEAAADLHLGYSFNIFDPNVVKFLQERTQRFSVRVNDVTWQQLKDTLEEGIKNGDSIPDFQKRIEDTMTLAENQRSETIARTEVVGANNGGRLESFKQSGVVTSKTWIATFDGRERDTHANTHGQEVGIDEDFTIRDNDGNVTGVGQAPGQIGVASEDINCRCTITAVV